MENTFEGKESDKSKKRTISEIITLQQPWKRNMASWDILG